MNFMNLKALKLTALIQDTMTGGPNSGQQQVVVYATDENDVSVLALSSNLR